MSTYDDQFIAKLTSEKEFSMFRSIAKSYFEYMSQNQFESQPSLLCKIYGVFEIMVRGENYFYLIMENLYYPILSS